MEYFISGLWIGLELASILLFFLAFLQHNKRNKAKIYIVFVWLIIFATNNLSSTQTFSPFIRYIAIYCLTLYLFSGHWYVHLFLEVLITLFILLIDTAISYGTCSLLQISLSELTWRKLTYATAGTLSKLIVLLCAWLIYRTRNSYGLKGIHGKWFLLTILFPIVSIIIVALNYTNNRGREDVSLGVFLISLVLVIANIGIVYLVHTLERSTIQRQEMALLQQQMVHQKENYAALENSYSLQRKSAHEFERHIQTLGDLLDQEEYQTAVDYVYRLKKNRTHRLICIKSNHPVIDVILNQKYQVAKEKGISMQIQINDLSYIEIQTDWLVILLSNLLDNAIEACQKMIGRKEICCSILYNDGVYISIRNTSEPVTILNNEISSNHSMNIEHGYGIPAIKYVLEKLSAEYIFEYANGWFQFVAEIPI